MNLLSLSQKLFKPADRVGERVKREGGGEWAVYKEGFQVNKLLHGRTHTHEAEEEEEVSAGGIFTSEKKGEGEEEENE